MIKYIDEFIKLVENKEVSKEEILTKDMIIEMNKIYMKKYVKNY